MKVVNDEAQKRSNCNRHHFIIYFRIFVFSLIHFLLILRGLVLGVWSVFSPAGDFSASIAEPQGPWHVYKSSAGWSVAAPRPICGSQPYLVPLNLRPLVRRSLITPEGLCFRSSSSLTTSPAAQHSISFTRLIAAECHTVVLIII